MMVEYMYQDTTNIQKYIDKTAEFKYLHRYQCCIYIARNMSHEVK